MYKFQNEVMRILKICVISTEMTVLGVLIPKNVILDVYLKLLYGTITWLIKSLFLYNV